MKHRGKAAFFISYPTQETLIPGKKMFKTFFLHQKLVLLDSRFFTKISSFFSVTANDFFSKGYRVLFGLNISWPKP